MAQLISNASVPFYYVIPAVASLAPTANASSNITFDADSRFTWYKTTYFCDIAGAAITDGKQPIPMLTITMTDTGSSRQFSSLALPLDTFAGRKGSEPCILPAPKVFSPNATLRATFSNYSAATTYTNIFIVLHGVKEYL
jgi:hypothetical protein